MRKNYKILFIAFAIIFLCSFVSSCCIIDLSGETKCNSGEIKLLTDYKHANKGLYFRIFFSGNYEMIVPYSKLREKIYPYSKYGECKCWLDSLQNSIKLEKKIIITSKDAVFNYHKINKICEFDMRSLFFSGNFFIYDRKTNTFLEKVKYKEESWYHGPLAASYDFIVYIISPHFWEPDIEFYHECTMS